MAGEKLPLGTAAQPGLIVPEKRLTVVSEKGTSLAKRMREMSDEEFSAWQEQRSTYDPQELLAEMKAAFRRVNTQVVGREDVLSQTLFAFLTREHQLLYSRAGTAKTLLASTVFNQFDGADIFSIQMTKGTPEEALVGAINIEDLKKGKVRHNTDGSIVDARFAFFDEVFDANDVALRSLLGILNERWFRKGEQDQEALLHTAIAATNYMRSTDVTEAIVDRFAFRAYIEPDRDPYTMLRIDGSYGKTNGKTKACEKNKKVPFDYVEYLADIVEGQVPGKEISSPPHVLFLKNELILEYMRILNEGRAASEEKKPELYISPRTIAKTRDILNASALLNDRNKTQISDLDVLKYMICTIGEPTEDQEASFEKAKAKVLSIPIKDLEIVDTLMNTNETVEKILEAKELGKPLDAKLMERVKLFLGITDITTLTFERIIKLIEKTKPSNERVIQLQKSIVKRMQREEQRYNSAGKYDPYLF